tara:strand:- start:190 stop:606 length:417 start_codon:yes stop_codon:yes gene_type:complete
LNNINAPEKSGASLLTSEQYNPKQNRTKENTMNEIQRFKGNLNDFLLKTRTLHDGVQHIFRFPNDLGASVVCHSRSYGGKHFWELAVISFRKPLMSRTDEQFESGWYITYDTPITSDVLGWCTPREIASTLRRINRLD